MISRSPPSALPATVFLEHHPADGGMMHRILLSPLPFRIGRSKTAHWAICSGQVSKEHAEIVHLGGEFQLRDLGSTNGTFVNGQRIEQSPLADGDIVHFAHTECMFSCGDSKPRGIVTEPVTGRLPASFIRNRKHLLELLAGGCVSAVFQPIVNLDTKETLGYEALGRGNYPTLSSSPADLFLLAEECRLSTELSKTFRKAAMDQVGLLPGNAHVFLNTHPAELKGPALLEELARLRDRFGQGRQPVVEIHESAVPSLADMRELRKKVHDLDMLVAFDDFGAGQARLVELTEAPPDFIKLDRSLITGVDRSAARQEVMRSLCRVIHKLGIQIIAEGVETIEESQVCQALGCGCAQGYLYGRPQPLNQAHGN